MLHIGMDDTDSVEGGCTTWLATEVIKELSDFDLIGCPRLVRLNPNVPWKTRGNGAVSFTFGKGKGNKKKIGEIDGSNIFSFENGVSIKSLRALVYSGLLAYDQEEGNEPDYNEFQVGNWLEDVDEKMLTEMIDSMMESKILGNQLNMGIERNPQTKKKTSPKDT